MRQRSFTACNLGNSSKSSTLDYRKRIYLLFCSMKASPFAGKSEPLTDTILYPRYVDVASILQGPCNKAANKPAPGKASGKKRKSNAAAVDTSVVTSEAAAAKKAKQKKAKAAATAAKLASGPSNAEEARQLRERLGIAAAPDAPAPAAAKGFAFGFELAAEPVDAGGGALANGTGRAAKGQLPEADADEADEGTAGGVEPAAVMQEEEEEDPAVRERLRRVRGEPSGQDLSRRVFVGGMPFSYEEDEVREYWSYCGDVADLDLMRFPDSGRFKGIAFITFATTEGYEAALACDGEMLEQTRLKVEPCRTPRPVGRAAPATAPVERKGAAPKTPGYCVAYVGNIAFEAAEADVRAVFEGLTVTRVRMHTDATTGRFKGYAHVHFSDEASLDSAVQLNGTDFFGRQLRVGYAQPKK
ncbi:hypothetical protein WJX81_004857 [Elliptochloris bilobata]|uniref:RRM domain-containing protein n=1 Tax=Elliptochloris bilobata TaxID=381761 RepID=A0AAW1RUT4_9CHLO